MRPLEVEDIKKRANHAYQDIANGSHAATKHTGANWKYLLHRLAGSMQNNPPSRTLAFSSMARESDLSQVVNLAITKHASAIAEASETVMSYTHHDITQIKRTSDARHDPLSMQLDVDMEMDTDDIDNEPISGYGIVRDGETGRIRVMASTQFKVVLGVKNQFEVNPNDRGLSKWLSLKTVTCDLEQQLADNKANANIARANMATAPEVDLRKHIRKIPEHIAPPPLKATMLTLATPTITTPILYQRIFADKANKKPVAQVVAVEIGDGTMLAMRFNDQDNDRAKSPTFFLQSKDPLASGPIDDPARVRAIVTAFADEKAKDDLSILFKDLTQTGAISASFDTKWNPTKPLPKTIDDLKARLRAQRSENADKTINNSVADAGNKEQKTDGEKPRYDF